MLAPGRFARPVREHRGGPARPVADVRGSGHSSRWLLSRDSGLGTDPSGGVRFTSFEVSCAKVPETYRKIVQFVLVGAPNRVVEIVIFAQDTGRLVAVVPHMGITAGPFTN